MGRREESWKLRQTAKNLKKQIYIYTHRVQTAKMSIIKTDQFNTVVWILGNEENQSNSNKH